MTLTVPLQGGLCENVATQEAASIRLLMPSDVLKEQRVSRQYKGPKGLMLEETAEIGPRVGSTDNL